MSTTIMMTKAEIDNIIDGLVEYLPDLPPVDAGAMLLFMHRRNVADICASVFISKGSRSDLLHSKISGKQNGGPDSDGGHYVFARAATMLLLSFYGRHVSYPLVGRLLGVDHSTIVHAVSPATQAKYLKNEVYYRGLAEADRRSRGLAAASWSWLQSQGKADAFIRSYEELAKEGGSGFYSRPGDGRPAAYSIIGEAYRLATGRDMPVLRLWGHPSDLGDDLGAQGGGGEALAGPELQQAGEHRPDLHGVRPG